MQLDGSYEAILGRARGLYQDGDLEGAMAQYRRLVDRLARLSDRVLERRPSLREMRVSAILELGQLLEWDGRIGEAIELKRRLVELAPEEELFWKRHLAVLRVRKGEVDAGLEELRALAEADPEDPAGWNILATHLRLAGRLSRAEEILDRALAIPEQDPQVRGQVHLNRALLYKALAQVDEALAAWEEAVQDAPDIVETVPEMVDLLIDVGRLDEALAYVERDADELRRGLHRGIVLARQGKPGRARAAWTDVHEMDPATTQGSRAAWLEATLRLGDPDAGLDRFEELLTGESSARLFLLGGMGWAMKGDLEAARVGFRVALEAMSRDYPPTYKFDSKDWRLLDQLVDTPETKAQLKAHFAVVDAAFDAVPEVAGPASPSSAATSAGGILLPGRQS
jgi:tetratricopeptide (TPR) repeat protein